MSQAQQFVNEVDRLVAGGTDVLLAVLQVSHAYPKAVIAKTVTFPDGSEAVLGGNLRLRVSEPVNQ